MIQTGSLHSANWWTVGTCAKLKKKKRKDTKHVLAGMEGGKKDFFSNEFQGDT